MDVWHWIKFSTPNLQLALVKNIDDMAHVEPARLSVALKKLPAQFDTILVHD
jgi:hypothetical protein